MLFVALCNKEEQIISVGVWLVNCPYVLCILDVGLFNLFSHHTKYYEKVLPQVHFIDVVFFHISQGNIFYVFTLLNTHSHYFLSIEKCSRIFSMKQGIHVEVELNITTQTHIFL